MENVDHNQTESKQGASFQKIKEDQELTKLKDRFSVKNFCRKYAWAKWTALFTSYLIQIISIGLASYGVYWLLTFIIPYPIIGGLLTSIVLFFHALGQRKTSDALWDDYMRTGKASIALIILCIAFAGTSMLSSGFGNIKATIAANQDKAKLITKDSTLNFLQYQLAVVNTQITALKNTTWKKRITRKSQAAIDKATPNQNKLTAEVIARQKKVAQLNNQIQLNHEIEVWQVVKISLAIYILLELLFEGCMFFCSYYDWRKLVEALSEEEFNELFKKPSPITPHTDKNEGFNALFQKLEELEKKVEEQSTNPPSNGPFWNTNFLAQPGYYLPNQPQRPIGFTRYSNKENAETESGRALESSKLSRPNNPRRTNRYSKTETRTKKVLLQAEVEAQIQKKRNAINSYKWKIRNNYGKKSTAENNIARLEKEIKALEASAIPA